MRTLLTTFAIATLGVCFAGCSGYGSPAGGTAGNPSAPSGAIVIDIVGIKGAQSFSPNPATVPAGQMVVWHNVDTVTHRVALDEDVVNTGNLAPGAFSAPTSLSVGGSYHCTIHPEMAGSLMR
jgi:plastocyanin